MLQQQSSLTAQTCASPGDQSPAVPAPECVDSSGFATACSAAGAIRLWPSNFRPLSPIPATRDTTDRIGGKGTPGAERGYELFKAVDVVTVDGASKRLYAVYNAGIQAWDIASKPENPARLAFRDGWLGHFLFFPPVSEKLNYTEDIAAINNGAKDVVAVSGLSPVGPSFWVFDPAVGQFQAIYQDTGTEVTQIRLIKDNFGIIFAFAASSRGVSVYNVSAALARPTPCLDDQGTVCPGVYRGQIPGPFLGYYVDAILKPATNRIFVAAADGYFQPLEIFELPDPNDPSSAIERFDGSGMMSPRGIELFTHGGHHYLALARDKKLDVYLADACLSGSNCSLAIGSLEKAVDTITVSTNTRTPDYEFLDFSTAGGVNYLYYGIATSKLSGTAIEGLYDLSKLVPPGGTGTKPVLDDVTAGGGTYTDPCSGETIDYWSHYYARNLHGLREMHPRHGKFAPNGYFYRAAQSILDVHRLELGGGSPGDQTLETDVTSPAPPGPWWMSQPITFTAKATPASGCSGGTWTWTHGDTLAASVENPAPGTAVITYPLCPTADCPERHPLVYATNSACPDWAVIEEDAVAVEDPRPHIRPPITIEPPGGVYDVGTPLTFDAAVDGRDDPAVPMTRTWTVYAIGGATRGAGPVTATRLELDTCVLGDPDRIFSDGFESGLPRWTVAPPPSGFVSLESSRRSFEKVSAADYRIELEASNSQGRDFDDQTTFSLAGTEPLAFGPDGLKASAASQVDETGVTFTVDGNATEVRWEFEDDHGACVAAGTCASVCQYYPKCEVLDWSPVASAGSISHTWESPNLEGQTRRVRADIRKCSEGPLSREVGVTLSVIPVTVVPTVTTFEVDRAHIQPIDPSSPCSFTCFYCAPQEIACTKGGAITFKVTTDVTVDEYSFDWSGSGTFGAYTTHLTHTYSTAGAVSPKVKSRKGTGVSDPSTLSDKLTIQ